MYNKSCHQTLLVLLTIHDLYLYTRIKSCLAYGIQILMISPEYQYIHQLLCGRIGNMSQIARFSWLSDAGLEYLSDRIPPGLSTNEFVTALLDVAFHTDDDASLRKVLLKLQDDFRGHEDHRIAIDRLLQKKPLVSVLFPNRIIPIPSSTEDSTPPDFPIISGRVRDVLEGVFYGLLFTVLYTLLNHSLFPYLWAPLQLVIGVLLITILLMVYLLRRQATSKLRLFFTSFITIVVIAISGTYLYQIFFLEQRTVYFVIDASENMNVLPTVATEIKLRVASVPERLNVGLAVYGSQLGVDLGCDDFTQLVEPAPKSDSQTEIDRTSDLLSLRATRGVGVGGLHEAVLASVRALTQYNGVHQIVVITTSLDERCAPLNQSEVFELAQEVGVELELIVVSIGAIPPQDALKYDAYATRYIPIGTPLDLAPTLEEIVTSPVSPYRIYANPYPATP